MLSFMLLQPSFALSFENLHDLLSVLLAVDNFLLFFTLSNQNDDFSFASSAGPPKSLDHSDRGRQAIIGYDQVDISDIKTLLGNTSGDQRIQDALLELIYPRFLNFLGYFSSLPKKNI
jgi:hypothetical protein